MILSGRLSPFSRTRLKIAEQSIIMETNLDSKKKDVIAAAKKWWASQKDPKQAPVGSYVCDACGKPITEKRGTSLLGSYMRCVDCTGKMFSNWDEEKSSKSAPSAVEKPASSASEDKPEFKVEKCFHCSKNIAEDNSKHVITVIRKSTWENGGGKIKRFVLPRCSYCKQYVEWGDRTFIILLPILSGILLSYLLTSVIWLIPILAVLFYLPLVLITIKLLDLLIPKWKYSKAGSVEEHPEIKELLDVGWHVRRTVKEKIFAIW